LPYQPWDVERGCGIAIWEVPLVYMDTGSTNLASIREEMACLEREVREVNGLFTVNFHSDYLGGQEPAEMARTEAYSQWLTERVKSRETGMIDAGLLGEKLFEWEIGGGLLC
jgi:hypothetical protein